MQDNRDEELRKHRQIGIKHALNAFKDEGLISMSAKFPEKAAKALKDRTKKRLENRYKQGAKDVALALLDGFIRGDFTAEKQEDGTYQIECHVDKFKWPRKIVTWSDDQEDTVVTKEYELTLKQLGFEE